MDRATVDQLLTTTRTVQKRLDLSRPVEPEVIQECLEIAIQAPNGGNQHRYYFVVVTDPAKRAIIGTLYKRTFYREHVATPALPADVEESVSYLADHLSEVPVHIIPCVETRFENAGTFRQATRYGSILPAARSLMLALRSRGLGTAWTTLHLYHEKEVANLLGIPTKSLRPSFCLWLITRALTSGPGGESLLAPEHTGTPGDRTGNRGRTSQPRRPCA